MRVMLRCLLISLLILTLPLKGLAAAGYMACGPGHTGAAVAQHHAAVGDSSDHHHHADATTSHAATHASIDEAPGDAEDGSSKSDSVKGTKCVQCAPCCGAVAPQAEAPVMATDVNADTVVQQVCSLVVGGRNDRIDRPPRSLP
ncbi:MULTISPECIES: hypothetical protein [unclassified Roseateles]|uniref:hypothetical protein n=1 Tax=unclassified Roseateles TaxID=2626991 RepID=UPI000712F0B4|nr:MULTISPECIES: hypothetical protein [unclassified Roseateles]KQW51194.1 hypothetical protein ASC81_00625 [Pelomonas sp. Root405]KRA77426.1 hypothetical protein ASD88_00625 [Pelomonas sp. Root662]